MRLPACGLRFGWLGRFWLKMWRDVAAFPLEFIDLDVQNDDRCATRETCFDWWTVYWWNGRQPQAQHGAEPGYNAIDCPDLYVFAE